MSALARAPTELSDGPDRVPPAVPGGNAAARAACSCGTIRPAATGRRWCQRASAAVRFVLFDDQRSPRDEFNGRRIHRDGCSGQRFYTNAVCAACIALSGDLSTVFVFDRFARGFAVAVRFLKSAANFPAIRQPNQVGRNLSSVGRKNHAGHQITGERNDRECASPPRPTDAGTDERGIRTQGERGEFRHGDRRKQKCKSKIDGLKRSYGRPAAQSTGELRTATRFSFNRVGNAPRC